MVNIARQGKNVIREHLEHLKNHNQNEYLKWAMDFLKKKGIEIEFNLESQVVSV